MSTDWVNIMLRAAERPGFQLDEHKHTCDDAQWKVVATQACVMAAATQCWDTIQQLCGTADFSVQDFVIIRSLLHHNQVDLATKIVETLPSQNVTALWSTAHAQLLNDKYAQIVEGFFNRQSTMSEVVHLTVSFSAIVEALTNKQWMCARAIHNSCPQVEERVRGYLTTISSRQLKTIPPLAQRFEEYLVWRQRQTLLEHVDQPTLSSSRKKM